MKKRKINPWVFAALAGGALYPFIVYFGMNFVPPMVLVLVGLALLGLRLLAARSRADVRMWQSAFLVAACGMIGLLFLNAPLAVRAYPVFVSLSVAAVFAISLKYPPTIVERIARLAEPDLPREGVIYTRRVTIVWVVFLICNAFISSATAIWGTLAQWTLWNGMISYLLMGVLFVGEFFTRSFVRRKIK